MQDTNDIQLRRLDAGLLLTLEAILRERNLARAGATLGLTPSAVSHALNRLRDIFGDPLFQRRAQGVTPTPRALALQAPLAAALDALRGALAQGRAFAPAEIDRTFQVAALDAVISATAPPLLARLAREAPRAKVAFRVFGREDAREALRRGRIDLAIGVFGPPAQGERRRRVREEDFVVVARRGHPALGEGLTLERWLECDHLLVSAAGDLVGAVDSALAALGLRRRVCAAMPQFLAAFATVAASDLVATVALSVASAYAHLFDLELHAPPLALAPFELAILRAERAPDPALDWFEDAIVEARQG